MPRPCHAPPTQYCPWPLECVVLLAPLRSVQFSSQAWQRGLSYLVCGQHPVVSGAVTLEDLDVVVHVGIRCGSECCLLVGVRVRGKGLGADTL